MMSPSPPGKVSFPDPLFQAARPRGINRNSSTRVPRLRTVTVVVTSLPGATVNSAGSIVTRTPRFCAGPAGRSCTVGGPAAVLGGTGGRGGADAAAQPR